jgi:hypothetical protein
MKRIVHQCPPVLLALTLAATLALAQTSARANVYATHIRLNGSVTNVTANPGENVTISYILNEKASRGVSIDISRGSTQVRKLSLPANGPGTDRGPNSVIWDLRDSSANSVPGGTYSVSITAAADGYAEWTQISAESDINTYVYDGRGIAVDQQPASPYFGRILVANSAIGNDPVTTPGDVLGMLKFNADGSAAEEGITSTGGRAWAGNELAPWKTEAFGGYAYVNDLALKGQVFRWDPTFASNSLVTVLPQANQRPGAVLGGLALTAEGTNTVLWMADRTSTNGVLRWTLAPDGTCSPGDTGTTVVGPGSAPAGLTLPPEDVALDPYGNIYVCQSVGDHANPVPRVFRFPAYDPAASNVVAEWAVGAGDDTYGGASGIAVDPTGTYVAVSFQGVTLFGLTEGGNTKVLYATNGALVANIDLDLQIQGDFTHQDTDCAWDAAGNVYYIDNWWGRWRTVSPPGTNQMVTTAPAAIVVSGTDIIPPQITAIVVTNGVVQITFTGSPTDSPNSFIVLGSASLAGPFTAIPSAIITSSAPGVFTAMVPASTSMQFFRIERETAPPAPAPTITRIAVTGGAVEITFTGTTTDVPSAFGLLSATSPDGAYTEVPGATISAVAAGTFRATAPTEGPRRFYRILRR